MPGWATIFCLTLVAGAAMPLGAVVACVLHIQPDWLEDEFRHSVIAFGGGALFSAVSLVLVPEGSAALPAWLVAACFAAGGGAFLLIDIALDRIKSPSGQLVAMLSDFVPEALALGAAFSSESSGAPLLAGLIALQNLPEGFNAFRELDAARAMPSRVILATFSVMAFLGPTAGLTGYFLLSAYPAAVAGIMLFAAGGILYLVFQDIAPQAKLDCHWAPPLGAVLGFLLGLVGQLLAGG
ncbi:MAG: divalent cation transporter [Planctomycetota bacterium]